MFRLEIRKIRLDAVSYQPVATMESAGESTFLNNIALTTDAFK
jgi:hypothetical protein